MQSYRGLVLGSKKDGKFRFNADKLHCTIIHISPVEGRTRWTLLNVAIFHSFIYIFTDKRVNVEKLFVFCPLNQALLCARPKSRDEQVFHVFERLRTVELIVYLGVRNINIYFSFKNLNLFWKTGKSIIYFEMMWW